MLPFWLTSPWAHLKRSYVPAETWFKGHPLNLAVFVAGAAAISWGLHFLAPAEVSARYGNPALPVAFIALGAGFSGLFWWRRGEGDLAAASTLLDCACYSAGLSLAAARAGAPLSHGFVMALGLMLVTTQARDVALTPLMLVAAWAPALGVGLSGRLSLADGAILASAAIVFIYVSHTTGQQRAVRSQNERLRNALGTVDDIATRSMELALAATLLSFGDLVHQLRNAQTATLLNLKHLRGCPGLTADDREALQEAIAAEERSSALVNGALEGLQRQSRSEHGAVELEALVQSVAQRVEGIAVSYQPGVRRLELTGDPEQYRLVFQNLVRNSLEAGASRVQVRGDVEPSGVAVRVWVVDDGPGLPDLARRHLFHPFAGVGKRGGAGLGLFLVKRCVDQMGGRIQLEAGEPGAAFCLVLPGRVLAAGSLALEAVPGAV